VAAVTFTQIVDLSEMYGICLDDVRASVFREVTNIYLINAIKVSTRVWIYVPIGLYSLYGSHRLAMQYASATQLY